VAQITDGRIFILNAVLGKAIRRPVACDSPKADQQP